jgi:hypothetical protein
MAPRKQSLAAPALAVLLALAGCGLRQAEPGAPEGSVRFALEDQPDPEVFQREGNARRDAVTAPAGMWGVVAGLARPERALVRSLETGAEVEVALYSGAPGGGAVIRLSPQAADALGVLGPAVPVQVTALRREPRLIAP